MASDKISLLLEKQLKILGQRIRLDILKKLYSTQTTLSFSDLQKTIVENNSKSVNLTFHLNNLKDANFISSSENGYSITNLGIKILKRILSIEEIINKENKPLIIRTSKYSTEPFDMDKIKEFLIREADLNVILAEKITRIVKRRLSKTNIEYLTAPLIREYVNAILIEQGLEEIRHKLTRLGVPPFDVSRVIFETQITPTKAIQKLGNEVSEQFLLLNLLPKNLADLYLSGKIKLLHLNQWALQPFSILINVNNILESLENRNLVENHNTKFYQVNKYLKNLKNYFSDNILLYNFNEIFTECECNSNNFKKLLTLYFSQFFLLLENATPKIDFGLLIHDGVGYESSLSVIDFLSNSQINNFFKPGLFLNYPNNSKELDLKFSNGIANLMDYTPLTVSNIKKGLFDSANNNYHINGEENQSRTVLDKIYINLEQIALESNQNDDLFFEILEKRLDYVYELFQHKMKFLKKNLFKLKELQNLLNKGLNPNVNNWLNDTIKSVSFYNLNSAVKAHCGIELDRVRGSEDFAVDLLSFMRKIIHSWNEIDCNNYCLSQPHLFNYREDLSSESQENLLKQSLINTTRIIRCESSLDFKERIKLFKKIAEILDGGGIFEYFTSFNDNNNIMHILNKFTEDGLSAFRLWD